MVRNGHINVLHKPYLYGILIDIKLFNEYYYLYLTNFTIRYCRNFND